MIQIRQRDCRCLTRWITAFVLMMIACSSFLLRTAVAQVNRSIRASPSQSVELPPSNDFVLRVKVSPEEVEVAEPFDVQLELQVPSEADVIFRETPLESLGFNLAKDVVDQSVPVRSSNSLRIWTRAYQLECYLAGKRSLPIFIAEIRLPGDESPIVIESAPSSVTIQGLVEQDATFEHYRDLKAVPRSSGDSQNGFANHWSVAVVLLTGVAAASFFFFRRRSKASAHSIAISRIGIWLTQLNHDAPLSRGYEDLALILKDFLSQSLAVNTLSQSTEELLRELNRAGVPTDLLGAMGRFFREADRARFASASSPDDALGNGSREQLIDASKVVGGIVQGLSQWQLDHTMAEV